MKSFLIILALACSVQGYGQTAQKQIATSKTDVPAELVTNSYTADPVNTFVFQD